MKRDWLEIKDRSIIIWGAGNVGKIMSRYLTPFVNIKAFCDRDSNKWRAESEDGIPCVPIEELGNDDVVLIAVENADAASEIAGELEKRKLDYCHITEAVEYYLPEWDRREVAKYEKTYGKENRERDNRLTKFVDCYVPYHNCNLKCNYCYVRQRGKFAERKILWHSPEFISKALSFERLGGMALINLCARGETMLTPGLIPIIKELVCAGHYISIISNGTATKAFEQLLSQDMDLSHIFVKFSLSYLELKRLGLLMVFADNVKKVRAAGCSITVEVVPDDILVPYIPEIKAFSMEQFGALPHTTIPRDERMTELNVLTNQSMEDFKENWGFDSAMFDFKMAVLYEKRNERCLAGKGSFSLNLETGDMQKCVGNPYMGNLYEDISKEIVWDEVGLKCCLPYCYNGHAYLTLGLIKEIKAPTYYEVRDRLTVDGTHWVTDTMKEVFIQRLYENND